MNDLKAHFRARFLAERRALPLSAVARMSGAASTQVAASAVFSNCDSVVLYSPVDNEVRTDGLRREAEAQGKAVYYPRLSSTDPARLEFVRVLPGEALSPGRWGIEEPAGQEILDSDDRPLFVVPGVAFDARGTRLGRGGGHYDRALRGWRGASITMGLAYCFQLVPSLPRARHDEPMSFVVIETGVLACSSIYAAAHGSSPADLTTE